MHVLDKFRYCPVCGSADFEPSTVKSKRCRYCGFEYFLNPSAANAALIMNGRDELLVITRKNDPRLLFSYPNTYLYSSFTVHTLDFFFLCRVDDFTVLSAHDDAAGYEWIAVKKLRPERFGLDSIRRAVTRFQQDFESFFNKKVTWM